MGSSLGLITHIGPFCSNIHTPQELPSVVEVVIKVMPVKTRHKP